ncbi:unnamed protein product, partial [Allacma fusca]
GRLNNHSAQGGEKRHLALTECLDCHVTNTPEKMHLSEVLKKKIKFLFGR